MEKRIPDTRMAMENPVRIREFVMMFRRSIGRPFRFHATDYVENGADMQGFRRNTA